MIEKRIKDTGRNITYRHFNSITEYINLIEKTEVNRVFSDRSILCSHREDEFGKEFTETETYEEAKNLLLHGWDAGTERIKQKVKAYSVVTKRKPCYSVQGYTPCVPRYIIGIPDNMISSRATTEKRKVIKLYKGIMYNMHISTEEIIKESVKVLNLVEDLEASGIRVELNILVYTMNKKRTKHSIYTLCLKKSGQRLNLKQVAFPMVHPSMHRRINFCYIERMPEFNYKEFTKVYGYSYSDPYVLKSIIPDGYYLPPFIEESTIIDIEKYRCGNR